MDLFFPYEGSLSFNLGMTQARVEEQKEALFQDRKHSSLTGRFSDYDTALLNSMYFSMVSEQEFLRWLQLYIFHVSNLQLGSFWRDVDDYKFMLLSKRVGELEYWESTKWYEYVQQYILKHNILTANVLSPKDYCTKPGKITMEIYTNILECFARLVKYVGSKYKQVLNMLRIFDDYDIVDSKRSDRIKEFVKKYIDAHHTKEKQIYAQIREIARRPRTPVMFTELAEIPKVPLFDKTKQRKSRSAKQRRHVFTDPFIKRPPSSHILGSTLY